jgi:hypothetical protein
LDESLEVMSCDATASTQPHRGELAVGHELIHGGAADAEKAGGFLDGEKQSLVTFG